MSRFYGSLKGNRGEATRCGTAKSGINSHARGWHIGARVSCFVNQDGQDEVWIRLTGGSSNPSQQLDLGGYILRDGKIIKNYREANS